VGKAHGPVIQDSPLAVVPSTSVQAPSGGQGTYRFGTISALDAARIEATFVLKNAGRGPLSVSRLEPSCGCTTALLTPAAKLTEAGASPDRTALSSGRSRPNRTGTAEAELVAMEPGETASLRVTVNLTTLHPGPVSKFVTVYVAGRDTPAAICEVQGTLTAGVVFSPPVVQLGRLFPEESKSFVVTARLDRRLASGPASPRLVASSPAIRIVPDAGPAGPEPAAQGVIERKYRISLTPDAPIGYFQARLFFNPEHTDVSATTLALINTSVPVVGEVTGSVSAQPLYLAFGTVPRGTRTEREVVLTSSETSFPSGARVASASPNLVASLQTPVGATAKLVVVVVPTAPRGILQGQITVLLAGGRQLVIPVSGYVN